MELKIEYLPIEALKPYEQNARKHTDNDVEKIAESIKRYGFSDPVGIWGAQNIIVEGHGRILAATKLGMTSVPCIRLDHLSEKQRREYAIAHNKTAEFSAWDNELLSFELQELDMSAFDMKAPAHFWGDTEGEENEEYNAFTDKFKPKLTTDDCYTPPLVYEAVRAFAVEEYNLDASKIIRPFYPGGNYETENYPKGCTVIDNPPFSIISQICKFYDEHKINYFLFAPALTLFSANSGKDNYLTVGVNVTYENGANVCTSFVTNLGEYKIDTAPKLYKAVCEANESTQKTDAPAELPNYIYPNEVITPKGIDKYSKHGANIKIKHAEFIRRLDEQKEQGKEIFGSGFLISSAAAEKAAAEKAAAEKAAAEKAAAEKAAAEKEKTVWELSEREKEIIRKLGELET